VKTFEPDYVRVHPWPDAATVIGRLQEWLEHYNKAQPDKALRYSSA